MDNAAFAEALREAIRKKKMTQGKLAGLCGVHQSTISRWLAGEDQPRGRHLQALARVLEAPHLVVGSEGVQALEDKVLDLLLQIAERAMIGQSLPHAAEAVLPGVEATEAERRLLARAAPGIRKELSQAAAGEWELLSPEDRRELVEQVAAHHLGLPETEGSE